jgi:hypothetical protein
MNDRVELDNDPFMTHVRAPQVELRDDPFLTHNHSKVIATPVPSPIGGVPMTAMTDVVEHPFMLNPARQAFGPPPKKQLRLVNYIRFLGPQDHTGTAKQRNMLVMVPWALFVWTILLWLLMRHYSYPTTVLMTALVAVVSSFAVLTWRRGMVSSTVAIGPLGLLCLCAIVLGVVLGMFGWEAFWRQYWWTQTGARYVGNTANTPAGSQLDAAVVNFADPGTNTLLDGTSVDSSRAAGYRKWHMYCAAPVLSPLSTASGLARVNYWAIGIDCCQPYGGFTCGASRSYKGTTGVVMLEGGYPCPNCNVELFDQAIAKAEAQFGLVSAAGALRVLWVEKSEDVIYSVASQAILYLVASCAISFFIFFAAGLVVWYKGYGKKPLSTDLHLIDDKTIIT